jgi:hypothetical protein
MPRDVTKGRARIVAVVAVMALLAGGCALERASVSSSGGDANAASSTAAGVTDDGRFTLFGSIASNIVFPDTNSAEDVFRRDDLTDTTVRVDVSSTGAQLPQGGFGGRMSKDGRYVVFVTRDPAVPTDTNGAADVYLRDTVAGTTTLASPPPAEGFLLNSGARAADVSDDGRYVAFTHGNSTTSWLHRFDRQTGVTTRYIVGEFTDLFMSGDAEHFALNTGCYNVGGCFPLPKVFDVPGSTPQMQSLPFADCPGDRVRALSDDGVHLVWYSAKQYDPSDLCPARGHYIVHRPTGGSIVPPLPAGAEVIGVGRFASSLLYLAPGDALPGGDPARTQLYLMDVYRSTHHREDFTVAAGMPDASVGSAVLSDGGRAVAFVTPATNMVPDDRNGVADVFVRPTGMPQS